MKEIKKRRWSRFCSNISERHQYARTEVRRAEPEGIETVVSGGLPLLGVSLVRRRGRISAFEARLR